MKVVSHGSHYQIYSDDIQTHDKLPAGTYNIRFHPMQGFSLEKVRDYELKEEKVYGAQLSKVDKLFRTYEEMTRSLGVIMSGDKGIGKTLFAQMIGIKGREMDVPTIIVDANYDGLTSFLSSIEQECIYLFDEFEKIFRENSEGTNQVELLSYFDGSNQTKNMYVLTVNEINKVSSYLLNRPGRLHYHIRFKYPNVEEVREYMKDKLFAEHYDEIDEICKYSAAIPLNYDHLRAIALEVNMGGSFYDALEDLNISAYGVYSDFIFSITTQFGTMTTRKEVSVFSNFAVYFESSDFNIGVNFTPDTIIPLSDGTLRVEKSAVEYWIEDVSNKTLAELGINRDDYFKLDYDERAQLIEIKDIEMIRVPRSFM